MVGGPLDGVGVAAWESAVGSPGNGDSAVNRALESRRPRPSSVFIHFKPRPEPRPWRRPVIIANDQSDVGPPSGRVVRTGTERDDEVRSLGTEC